MSDSRVRLAVLDYGIGNLRSAQKALEHVGANATLTADLAEIDTADAVVLPGVGAFGACLDALAASGLDGVVHSVIREGRPFLGICVGMQMLYSGSDENPTHAGLGIVERRIHRLPDGVKRPQMQWNRLCLTDPSHPMFAGLSGLQPGQPSAPDQGPWVYFVHGYAAEPGDEVVATCDYGGPLTAAIARDNVWATQFHPEKSGATGLAILANFVSWAAAA